MSVPVNMPFVLVVCWMFWRPSVSVCVHFHVYGGTPILFSHSLLARWGWGRTAESRGIRG